MKILVIGNGGREFSIIKHFLKYNHDVHCIPGGIILNKVKNIDKINIHEYSKIVNYAKINSIDFTICGPEEPLSNGLGDYFKKKNLLFFGPSKKCAKLESSKVFMKETVSSLNIPTSPWKKFRLFKDAKKFLIKNTLYPIVIKSSNLAGGKGVYICKNLNESLRVCDELLINCLYGVNNELIIENFLDGKEISCMALIYHDKVMMLPAISDYKKIFDKDIGPNTGGMGATSDLNFFSSEDNEYVKNNFILPIVQYLKKNNEPYCGVLYAGLIKTSKGIFLLEYNVRFGDPETEVIMEKLNCDLGNLIFNLLNNTNEKSDNIQLSTSKLKFSGVVVVSKGYPNNYKKNLNVEWIKQIKCKSTIYMGIKKNNNNELINKGGRIVMFIVETKNIKSLYKQLNLHCDTDNYFHYRKDIR